MDTMDGHQLEVRLDAEALRMGRLPESLETALYRIVQESLTNIVKYASATHVALTVTRQNHEIEATITDNGRGFQSSAVGKVAVAKSLGLASIYERAAILGGAAQITSAPQQGTTIRVTIPLPRDAEGNPPS